MVGALNAGHAAVGVGEPILGEDPFDPPSHRAKAAAKRALFYGVLDYRGVKKILVNALDLEPLPVATPVGGTLSQPRFARRIDELMVVTPEGNAHGPN